MSSMGNAEKIKAYYGKEGPFKKGIRVLRDLALQTELEEDYKWNAPIYTIEGKNVLGIVAFKHHFGIWFFNGSFLKDPKKVLENSQEGKTRAMRHWKFTAIDQINPKLILAYIYEAIENQKKEESRFPKRKNP